MVANFDIFKLIGGELRWLEAADTVQAAQARIEQHGETLPGKFVIYNQKTAEKIVVSIKEKQSPRLQRAENTESA